MTGGYGDVRKWVPAAELRTGDTSPHPRKQKKKFLKKRVKTVLGVNLGENSAGTGVRFVFFDFLGSASRRKDRFF